MDTNCNLIRNKVERKFEAATGAGDLGWLMAVLGHSILAGNDFWLSISRNVGTSGYRPINNWIACDEMWCRHRIYNNCKPLGEWDWVFLRWMELSNHIENYFQPVLLHPIDGWSAWVGVLDVSVFYADALQSIITILFWTEKLYGPSLTFRCWVFLDNTH